MQKRSSLAWLSPPRIGATAVWLSCVGWTCHTEDAMKNGGEPAKDQSVQYDVRYVPGGMDRVILTKRDNARNLCVQVTLVSPTPLSPETPTGKLQLPPDWTLDRAIAVHDAGACRGTMRSNPANVITATEVSGSVRWGSSPTDGTAVDLRLSFPAQGAEPAFSERMSFTR